MKKTVIVFIILAIFESGFADIYIRSDYNKASAKSFVHNFFRITAGTMSLAIPSFALLIVDNPAPIYSFPLFSSTAVFITGRKQKYDGKFWTTFLGSCVTGLPAAIGMHYSLEHKISNRTINLLLVLALSQAVFANFGFNISTKNKEEVLKLSFFGCSNHLRITERRNINIRELNSEIRVRLNILTINL